MGKHRFYWVDAFTLQRFGGNPCAIVLNADDLTEQPMIRVAREMNLSETAFVLKSERARFRARYFTPYGELPLAGHPTIATVHALLCEGVLDERLDAIFQLELKAGIVGIEISTDAHGRNIVMSQCRPEFLLPHAAATLAPLCGLQPSDFRADLIPQTVSTGTPQLMIALNNLETLAKVKINFPEFVNYRLRSDFSSAHFFCTPGLNSGGKTFARHPGSESGALEDPFTGSATGAMAAYLWRYGVLDSPVFLAEQGHWMGRPGAARVEVMGPRHNIETVKVAGSAVSVINGVIEI